LPVYGAGPILPISPLAMSRLRSALAPPVLAVILCGILSGQTDSGLSRYVQPNANILIGINWKLARQSAAAKTFREKLLDSSNSLSIRAMPGLEFLDDIDRILVSGRSSPETTETAGLIAVGGHFDLAKIRKMLTTFGFKPQLFHSTQVYRPQGASGQNMALVLVNPQTILVGDSPSIFDSLERNTFPPAAPDPNSMLARAAEMDANYDVWVFGNGLNKLAGERIQSVFGNQDLSTEERGFEAGVSLRSGFAADMTLRFETEAAAKKLIAEIDKKLKEVAKDKASEAALSEIEKKLKISAEGSDVRISLHLTPQELEKNAQMLAEMQKQAGATALVDVRPTGRATAPPPQPEKREIRIEGLDDGPRVIPYQQQ
jgi:hypothetical protein